MSSSPFHEYDKNSLLYLPVPSQQNEFVRPLIHQYFKSMACSDGDNFYPHSIHSLLYQFIFSNLYIQTHRLFDAILHNRQIKGIKNRPRKLQGFRLTEQLGKASRSCTSTAEKGGVKNEKVVHHSTAFKWEQKLSV